MIENFCQLFEAGVGTTEGVCCNADLVTLGYCTEIDRIVIDDNVFQGQQLEVNFESSSTVVVSFRDNPQAFIPVNQTGTYALAFSACAAADFGEPIVVNGNFTFDNAYGEMPVEFVRVARVSFGVWSTYMLILVWWVYNLRVQTDKDARHVSRVQWVILLTCTLGVAEHALTMVRDLQWNKTGIHPLHFRFTGTYCVCTWVSIWWVLTVCSF